MAKSPLIQFKKGFVRLSKARAAGQSHTIHQAGVETVKLGRQGNLGIYGKAVSICHALRYRERIGLDLALEALRTCLRQGGSVRALEEWADVCRIRKTLATYLEAILQ